MSAYIGVNFPSFVVLGSTVLQKTIFVFPMSSKSVSGGFYMIGFSPCIPMFRCPIVLFIDFYICLLMSFSVRLAQVLRKPCWILLRSVSVVGLKSDAWIYCASSGLFVYSRMPFATISDFCVSRGTSHIPVCLFLVPFTICCPFF